MIDAVINSVLSMVQALSLSIGGNAVSVVKGKQPKQEAPGSANTQITVHPAQRPHDVIRFTSMHDLHRYSVRVTTWLPGNQDNTPSGDFSAIEDALQQAFNKKPPDLLGLDDLRDVRAQTALYVDRGAFTKNWDVQALDVTVEIVRLR